MPILGLSTVVLLLISVPGAALGADWSAPVRLTEQRGSRLDSLHQLAAGGGELHVVHPRVGRGKTDDRVIYQRSADGGATWTRPRSLFLSTAKRRNVMPNLAIDANGDVVVVAWRVNGPGEAALFVRTSTDGGRTFDERRTLATAARDVGIGVPAVAIGDDVVAVAWTNRANGKIKVRSSRDRGRTFRSARTVGRTRLSIDCRNRVTDGLVGLAAARRRIHLAWSFARTRDCQASKINVRTSRDRGKSWKRVRAITGRRSYGWPELDARGDTVVATIQSPSGGIIVARSAQNGRNWDDRMIKPRKGHSLSSADVVLLPNGRAMITYVDERVRRSRLVNTRIVSRVSRKESGRFLAPKGVTTTAARLRMAPNIAAIGLKETIVFQAGPLDASRRNLYATRLR